MECMSYLLMSYTITDDIRKNVIRRKTQNIVSRYMHNSLLMFNNIEENMYFQTIQDFPCDENDE